MKINNKIIGLSLLAATSILTGCVKDTLYDEPSSLSQQVNPQKSIYSTITELDVVTPIDIPLEEFDKQMVQLLEGKKNLSSTDLNSLFSSIGKTTITNNASIRSVENRSFDYLPQKDGYVLSNYKIIENQKEYNIDQNGFYSNLKINVTEDNKFSITSMITKLTSAEKRKFVYQGILNPSETYPIYLNKENNNNYKIVLIQIQKIKNTKKGS